MQQAKAKADSEALSRRVAEEDIAELEKEKMMIELELKDIGSKHRADARNLETQLAAMKDSESDLLQKIDLLTRDNADLQDKVRESLRVRQLAADLGLADIDFGSCPAWLADAVATYC